MEILEQTIADFQKIYGGAPEACGVAPGRVEVLGNHTDYNEGYILSAAIDRHIVVCGRKAEGKMATVHAAAYNVSESFPVDDPTRNTENFWINYVEGVVDELSSIGIKLGGFEAVVGGNVPLGSGLSSSAAMEVATLYLLKELFPFEMDKIKVALTAQAAENHFVGVNCGILDQFSSVMGKEDNLIFLDCRHLDKYDHVPLGHNAELVLANTKAKHSLADGTYNKLRESCFKAASYFNDRLEREITHLRDVLYKEFKEHAKDLDGDSADRACHVISENERVLKGVEALKDGNLKLMGECMLNSHFSSRDNFGNSCQELDVMVDCAQELPGLYGCRLSGGGFGGCTVNLVETSKAEEFVSKLRDKYTSITGIEPEMHICRAADGAYGKSL